MKLKLRLFTIQMLLSTSLSFSQALPADNTFFNPTTGSGTQTISPSAGTGDDTQIFINAIDALTASGGIITVQAGTYRILEFR